MNPTRCLIILSLGISLTQPAQAQLEIPEWEYPPIEFQNEDTPIVLKSWTAEPDVPEPKYALSFSIYANAFQHPEDALKLSRQQRDPEILKTSAATSFSRPQRDLIENTRWIRKMARHWGTRRQTEYVVYAVSEADAQLLAQAILEIINKDIRRDFESYWQRVQDGPQTIANATAQIPQAQAEIKRLKAEMERLGKTVPYQDVTAATQDINELSKLLRAIKFDIVEIQAKIATIRRIKAGKGHSIKPDTRVILDQMLIQLDIELAGSLARQAAVEEPWQKAEIYCTAVYEFKRACERKTKLENTVDNAEKLLMRADVSPKQPPVSIRPSSFMNNRVFIGPVVVMDRQKEDTSPQKKPGE